MKMINRDPCPKCRNVLFKDLEDCWICSNCGNKIEKPNLKKAKEDTFIDDALDVAEAVIDVAQIASILDDVTSGSDDSSSSSNDDSWDGGGGGFDGGGASGEF